MEVKDILRNRRIELDLTMKELAQRVGVSEATISRGLIVLTTIFVYVSTK